MVQINTVKVKKTAYHAVFDLFKGDFQGGLVIGTTVLNLRAEL